MIDALPRRVFVPASFRWRDVTKENVAVRFKGNSSSSPNAHHKRSFLIKFDKFDKQSRFLGLRRVSFDNAIQFGSLFSEPIITGILLDLGIPTHRANYAQVHVNGEFQGVYVNVERIDETFIENQLPDPNGALFKVDEGGAGCNLQFVGDDLAVYKKTFEPKSPSAEEQQGKLVDFIKLINSTPKNDYHKMLSSNFEQDDFLRITAVMLFSGAFDQLTGWNPHNYYLYYDGQTSKWRYLPWDLDVGFSATAFGRIRVLQDWHAGWPVAPGPMPNPLLDGIADNPELRERYREFAKVILETHFQPDRLCRQLDAKYKLIKPYLEKDPFPHRRVTNPSDRDYEDILSKMKEFVRARYDLAHQQLQDPGPKPLVKRGPGPPGLPPELVRQVKQLEQRVRDLQRDGYNIRPIQETMREFGPLIRQGQRRKAEQVLQAALQRANAMSSKE